jgi:D-ribose pyranase
MIKTGLLNPAILSLIARTRHTNSLVIADRGFPFWPAIETVDISLVDDVPTVLDVLRAMLPNFQVGRAWMAREFAEQNGLESQQALQNVLGEVPVVYEPHPVFKRRVPTAIGLIRTGDTTQYANIILESA